MSVANSRRFDESLFLIRQNVNHYALENRDLFLKRTVVSRILLFYFFANNYITSVQCCPLWSARDFGKSRFVCRTTVRASHHKGIPNTHEYIVMIITLLCLCADETRRWYDYDIIQSDCWAFFAAPSVDDDIIIIIIIQYSNAGDVLAAYPYNMIIIYIYNKKIGYLQTHSGHTYTRARENRKYKCIRGPLNSRARRVHESFPNEFIPNGIIIIIRREGYCNDNDGDVLYERGEMH